VHKIVIIDRILYAGRDLGTAFEDA